MSLKLVQLTKPLTARRQYTPVPLFVGLSCAGFIRKIDVLVSVQRQTHLTNFHLRTPQNPVSKTRDTPINNVQN